MHSYTLLEINEHIRQVVALNFADSIWIRAEIAQMNVSGGHCYLDVVQRAENTDELIARSSAVIWKRTYQKIKRKSKISLEQILVAGNEICCKAKVDFHERYGYKLIIEEIDEDFTLGKILAQRTLILQRLQQEKLLQLNASLALPLVIQKVAIISSLTAAGLQDFNTHLEQNPWGYAFKKQLFPAVMQGDRSAESIAQQIQNVPRDFDVIVIIRGGGARLDLSAFDEYELGKAIAQNPLPVFTGIGHDIDETVADQVAHTALKTPTAVADCILYHNAAFESELNTVLNRVGDWARHLLQTKIHHWDTTQQEIRFLTTQIYQKTQRHLDSIESDLQNKVHYFLQQKNNEIALQSSKLETLDWQPTLERGFAWITQNGKKVDSVEQLSPNEYFNIRFKDGEIKAKVC